MQSPSLRVMSGRADNRPRLSAAPQTLASNAFAARDPLLLPSTAQMRWPASTRRACRPRYGSPDRSAGRGRLRWRRCRWRPWRRDNRRGRPPSCRIPRCLPAGWRRCSPGPARRCRGSARRGARGEPRWPPPRSAGGWRRRCRRRWCRPGTPRSSPSAAVRGRPRRPGADRHRRRRDSRARRKCSRAPAPGAGAPPPAPVRSAPGCP